MQTFLPYADFNKCAQCLDSKRLGNQFYREGLTLLRGGWKNHPASKMWSSYKAALCIYLLACADELTKRGRHYQKHIDEVEQWLSDNNPGEIAYPPWLGDERLHSTHRANLLRKDPNWYAKYRWKEQPSEGYYWPV